MTLYKKMKAMVPLPNGDTDFFNIVAGVLQGDTLASYMFIICPKYILTNINRSNKGKLFHIKKDKKKTISHRNYDRHRLHK